MATPLEQAMSIVQELWDIARVLIMVALVQLDTVFHLYTWFPYQSHQQCDVVRHTVLRIEWSLLNDTMVTNNKNIYLSKVPKNFHGCPITASIPNSDTDKRNYISNFLTHLNFTADLNIKLEYHWSLYERRNSSKKDVVFGSSEIVFEGIHLNKETANVANPSFPYYKVVYILYVPCTRPLSCFRAISKIFSICVDIPVGHNASCCCYLVSFGKSIIGHSGF
jgi:hypothetical protein